MSGLTVGTFLFDNSSNVTLVGVNTYDRDAGGVLIPPAGTAFPATPEPGEMFWRTDLSILYRRDDANTTWEAVTSAVAPHALTHISTGSDPIPIAVPSGASGLLSGADKAKLDGVAAGATNTPLTSAAPADVTKAAAAAGVSTSAARADHKHDISTAAPSTVGTANAEGSSTSLARADHVHNHGNQAGGALHADVIAAGASGFMAGADKTKLDGIEAGAQVTSFARVQTALNAATSAVGVNNQTLANVATPVASTDGANKAYVDSVAAGLRDTKDACRVATTANVGLSGLAAIDGVTPVAGDRVLVKNQSTASQNGIYVAAAGAWSRSTDADTSAEVTSGMNTFITAGSTQANTSWLLTTPDPIVLGTTALSFAQVGGGGAALATTPPVSVDKTSNAVGVGTTAARADHKHDVSTAAPATGIGAGNAEGSATTLARSDHNHALRESGGQDLTLGAIASGQFLQRSGTAIVGVTATSPLLQTDFAELTADQSTTSATFVDIPGLSITLTAAGGSSLLINFTCAYSNSSANTSNAFRLLVDGVAVRATSSRYNNTPADCVALVVKVAVAAGSRTIKMQWQRSGGTLRVRPASQPSFEHASLLVQEVTV